LRSIIRQSIGVILVVSGLAAPARVRAQASSQPPPLGPLTLAQAIQYAAEHYPTARAAIEQINVSTSGVSVAKSAFLPRLDSMWQSNRGTANNIFSQVLPQSVIPSMSGPVLASASAGSVWGSATGALFSWEAFDFGLRQAAVAGAEAAVARARAGEQLTRLDIETAVGAAFLGIVGAQRAVTALQADVDRRDLLSRATRTTPSGTISMNVERMTRGGRNERVASLMPTSSIQTTCSSTSETSASSWSGLEISWPLWLWGAK
jgi:outer membrane protein TolC